MKKIKTTIFLVTMLLFSIVLPKQSYGQFPSYVFRGLNTNIGLIRNYDMQTMNMVDRQYFDPNSKVAPQEMTYVESVDRFVLLEPFNFAGTQNANFIFLQSGGIPYNARLLFYPSIEFWSLDCFNIQYFISCAPHNIYFQDCAVPVPYNPTCIQENDISVKIMPTVSFTNVYSPLLAASCLGSMDTVLQNWISLQFDYDCHNN